MKHYIGVDLGGTKTEVVVLDQNSQEIYRERNPTPKGEYQGTLENISSLVHLAEQSTGLSELPVGIGIPGTVSKHSGLVKNANSTWLNGQPLQQDLEQILKRPVKIMNDANCLAVSEAVDGAGSGHDLVFAAILGTGCGAGLAFQKQAISGPNGISGEWGHVPMPNTTAKERMNRPCYCGQQGCVETFLSGTGLELSYRLMYDEESLSKDIYQSFQQGEARAHQVIHHYQQQLLEGLVMIINILDPDIIVLGGGVSNVDELYPFLNQSLPGRVFGGECETKVVKSHHGDSSGVRGAAWLNLRSTLS